MRQSKGFSLVELIMAIVIIGVLAAVAGPRFFSTAAFSERYYAEELLAGLRYARRAAEISNCSVQFRLTANGYDLAYNANCFSGGPASYTLPVPDPSESGAPFVRTDKPSSMSQTATTTPFVFLPQGGVANTAGSIVSPIITLNGSEVIASVSINGISGYAVLN
jgi:MSHA pilin protein MshC